LILFHRDIGRGPWTLNRTKKKELTLDSLPLPKLLENYDKGLKSRWLSLL